MRSTKFTSPFLFKDLEKAFGKAQPQRIKTEKSDSVKNFLKTLDRCEKRAKEKSQTKYK